MAVENICFAVYLKSSRIKVNRPTLVIMLRSGGIDKVSHFYQESIHALLATNEFS